jgi:FSR family fosmidomycin resistance protein-like MFS transporter
MNLLRDRSFVASGFAHLAVDLLNSTRAVYLAFLSQPLNLTNTLIGLIGTLYTLLGSLSQPLFGYLADRVGSKILAVVGVLWMVVFFSLAQLVPGSIALVFLVVASLGSAAFHPAGTMVATLRARDLGSQNETMAASVFFLFGQAGLSLGPAISGPILDRWGLPGLLLLLIYVIPTGINAGINFPSRDRVANEKNLVTIEIANGLLFTLIALTTLRSWVQMNMISFLPKYLNDLGYAPRVYGPIAALFMAGSAFGGVTGGWLGDRYRKMIVVAISLLVACFPLALYPIIAGFFTGIPHSIIVVLTQRILPGRVGMASGIILGFTFASGSIGTLISGAQADHFGFEAVFLTTAGISFLAGLVAVILRKL